MSVRYDMNKTKLIIIRSLEVIENSCYDCDINSDKYKEEVDITPIEKNTTFSSQIYGVKVFCKFYTPLLLSTNREGVPPGTDFELAKRLICRYKNFIIDSLLNIFLSFGWKV